MKVQVVITAYNRPVSLRELVEDLKTQAPDIPILVADDHSDHDHDLSALPVSFMRAPQNHGKRHYWRWINQILGHVRAWRWNRLIWLPDDVRVCRRFYDRCEEAWQSCPADRRGLNVLLDDGREDLACWTQLDPVDVGAVTRTGWIDGAFYSARGLFDRLDWSLHPVDPKMWAARPLLGSGVWAQVSHRAGPATLYRVKESLVDHLDIPSQMNPEARRLHPMKASTFRG